MKFDQNLNEAINACLDADVVPMLLGEPGIGKSSWLEALATARHTKCFTLPCNQLADKADLTGARLVPITDKDGAIIDYVQNFYPHKVIHEAIEYALNNPRETPILFLDELNRTTSDVTSEALSIPTMRKIGGRALPQNLKVVIAGNDKGNVTALDSASISRFALFRVAPDTATFLGLDANLNPFVRKVLESHPECIFCKTVSIAQGKKDDGDDDDSEVLIEEILDDGEAMNQLTTPRTISGVSRWLNGFSNDQLAQWLGQVYTREGEEISLLQEMLSGIMTQTVSASNSVNIGKPSCYDQMKSQTSSLDIEQFVDGMSENERSGCLLYALYEKQDNAPFIRALAQKTTITPTDMKTLMSLSATDKLDIENVRTFMGTGTPLATTLQVILNVGE